MWSSQHRMNNIIPLSNQIHWNATWLFLNNNQKRTYNYTNFQLSSTKTFRIKNILNILPTLVHQHNLQPSQYIDITCNKCKQHEQFNHWMRCPNYNLLLSIIQNTIQNTISTQILKISNHELQNLH